MDMSSHWTKQPMVRELFYVMSSFLRVRKYTLKMAVILAYKSWNWPGSEAIPSLIPRFSSLRGRETGNEACYTCSRKNMALCRTGRTEFTLHCWGFCSACLASENPANRISYAGSSMCFSSQAFNCQRKTAEIFAGTIFILVLNHLDNNVYCGTPIGIFLSQSLYNKAEQEPHSHF